MRAASGGKVRIALISDIHGDLAGLNAALAQIDRLGGADAIYALGDMIGVGPEAGAVLDRLVGRGVQMLRGNWEDLILDLPAHIHRVSDPLRAYPAVAEARADLSGMHFALLRSLPFEIVLEPSPGHRVLLCHAAPGNSWSPTCRPDVPLETLRAVYGGADADVIVYGHNHAHHVIALDGKLLVNVASVGMRHDGFSALTLLGFDGGWRVQQLLASCAR